MASTVREKIAKAMLLASALALFSSVFFPYWWLKITAPQYPKGLKVAIYLHGAKGDVGEIDILNHYIGMRSLTEAAIVERKMSLAGVAATVLCLLGAAFLLKRKWAFLLIIPALVFPAFFAADLYYWLRDFGLHLNTHAPLSSSIKPFVPPLLGQGKIAQFHAVADFALGHGLSMLAAMLALAGACLRNVKRKPSASDAVAAGFAIFLLMGFTFPAGAMTRIVDVFSPGGVQAAVDNAADGDTLLVKPGIYQGPLIINKSLRLIGEGLPVIDGQGKGTVVRLNAPDTVFQGFTIRASGDLLSPEDTGLVASGKRSVIQDNRFEDVLFGIYVKQAAGSVVRNNILTGKPLQEARRGDLIRVWYSNDVVIEGNRTSGGRDAVLWFSKNMTVRGNTFSNGRYGVHFMYCKDALVEKNRLTHNSVGAYLMYSAGLRLKENIVTANRGPSGYGIGYKDMDGAVIEGNVVASNRVGLFLDYATHGVCAGNLIAANDIGMQVLPTTRQNRFERNDFIDNTEQIVLDGQSVFTVNDWSANYWSDYRGYDADGDGRGDIPYKPVKLFERLTDRSHAFKIFFGSPAVQAIDFAASTFPVFAPTPKFSDNAPRMQPYPVALKTQAEGAPAAWVLLSGVLLLPLAGFVRGTTGPLLRPSPSVDEPQESKAPAAVSLPVCPAIRAEKISKRFRKVKALSQVDLEIRPGEAVALWGPNGAGKTTLLRCLLGIFDFEGSARVMGWDVKTKGKEARRLIGYVPQEIRLHLDQTVWETVCFYARLRKVSEDRVKALLAEWGLESAQKQWAQHLSGGMKQKLSLVIALLSDPPILFLDEPMSNLDVGTRREFNASLIRLKRSGKTLLFCSHRYAEVRRIADRVVVLEAGIKVTDGNPASLTPRGISR